MTFSVAARCPDTGQLGYAVATSSVCVGARVGAVLPGGCVVLSQARTDPRLHDVGLSAYDATGNAQASLDAMREVAVQGHWRQLGVLGATGAPCWHTGAACLDHSGAATGRDCLALGNYVATQGVLDAMVEVFDEAEGEFVERFVHALAAGERAGGERDPLQSTAIVAYGAYSFALTDLRIDKSTDPIRDMAELLADWMPKADAYVTRALDPDNAPSSASVEHGGCIP